MNVYESEFLVLNFYKENDLIEEIWKIATRTMSVCQFKEEFLNVSNEIFLIKPKKMLIDTSEMQFLITPDLQEWANLHIFPISLKVGLKKVAIISSKALISQISIEQMMEEAEGKKFTSRYFDDKAAAMNWILHV